MLGGVCGKAMVAAPIPVRVAVPQTRLALRVRIAPGVVLWAYGSGDPQLRAQLIHITPTGVEPLLVWRRSPYDAAIPHQGQRAL